MREIQLLPQKANNLNQQIRLMMLQVSRNPMFSFWKSSREIWYQRKRNLMMGSSQSSASIFFKYHITVLSVIKALLL